MAQIKLDMGKAWTSAIGLVGQNKDTITAIAGLFYFLPNFAMSLFVPEIINGPSQQPDPGMSPDAAGQMMIDQMVQAYARYWPFVLGLTLLQFIGSLSLLALINDRENLTVREALGRGLRSTPPYLAALLLSALAAGIALGLPLALIGAVAPPAVAGLAAIPLLAITFYLMIKFSLISPVIVMEGAVNPMTALSRSWHLTKGNSVRIAIFLVLLLVTALIITGLTSAILALILSLFQQSIADIGNGLVASIINSIIATLFVVVIAAVYRQFAGPSGARLADTFE